jgi:thiol-disulfide isomerase/thioredoxin
MKKSLTVLYLIFVLFSVKSQNNVIISGKIDNPIGDSITFIYFLNNITWEHVQHKAKVNEKGMFRTSFRISHFEYGYFNYNEKGSSLFLTPGDSLFLRFDFNDFNNTIVFSGRGGVHCSFFQKYRSVFDSQIDSVLKKISEKFSAEEFKEQRQKIYTEEVRFYNEYLIKNITTDTFRLFARSLIEYSYKYNLSQYSYHYAEAHKVKFDSVKMPAEYYDFFDNTNWDNSIALQSSYYTNLIYWYIYYEYQKDKTARNLSPSSSDSLWFERMAAVAKEKLKNESGTLKISSENNSLAKKDVEGNSFQWYMASLLYDELMQTKSLRKIDPYYSEFMSTCNNKILREIIHDSYQNAYEHLKNPQVPKEAKLTVLTDKTGKKITFDDILSLYKGKVIYIDFWASWCGACRHEMQYYKALQNKFKGKDVVFLFFDAGDSEQRWKATISELKIEGNHYLLNEQEKSELSKEYSITGLPRYIIIDKSGNVVDAIAPGPGNESVVSEIEKLLQ